jgi:hypothetical protein
VFLSVSPSLSTCRKEFGENGLMKTQAVMTIIIRDLVKSFNLGQTMDDEQVADLINDIIDQYYWLNIEDFRLCFNMAKSGRFDKAIFRLDASVVLTWLEKYTNDRLNAADEESYKEHQSTTGDRKLSGLENLYKKFEK